jgi:hypothetical protein
MLFDHSWSLHGYDDREVIAKLVSLGTDCASVATKDEATPSCSLASSEEQQEDGGGGRKPKASQ